MADKIFDLRGKAPPYRAQLVVGGGLPYKWDLYDYAPNGAGGWNRTHVCNGGGAEWTNVDAAYARKGHVLVWSVALVMEDEKAMTVDITARLGPDGQPAVQQDSFSASKENRRFFVSVGVDA